MKSRKFLFSLLSVLCVMPAFAGWEYNGYYINDGYYNDDGMRFVIGAHGGLSWANAKMKNDIGNLDGYYYINPSTGTAVSLSYFGDSTDAANEGFTAIAVGNIGDLPIKEKFSKLAFTAGGSIGFTIPYYPQWRLEAGYDHIAETEYNHVPLLDGNLKVAGDFNGVVHLSSTGVASTISTDIISVVAYYDFFDGNQKPLNQIIPYIGLGLGYATSKTTLKLSDIYGDLSTSSDLTNYGTPDSNGIIRFEPPTDKSKYPESENIAAIGALGVSYGISKYTFFDFGARIMYVPKITWQFVNSDASQHRDWFSAEDMIYTDLVAGVRFEF